MYMVIFGLKDVCKNKDCIGNCLKGHAFFMRMNWKCKSCRMKFIRFLYLYSEVKKTFLKLYFWIIFLRRAS